MKTIEKAIDHAIQLSKRGWRNKTPIFIIQCDEDEGGPYSISTPEEWDTYYQGMNESNLLFVIENGEIQD